MVYTKWHFHPNPLEKLERDIAFASRSRNHRQSEQQCSLAHSLIRGDDLRLTGYFGGGQVKRIVGPNLHGRCGGQATINEVMKLAFHFLITALN